MAEKENINQPKDLIEPVPEEILKIEVAEKIAEKVEEKVEEKSGTYGRRPRRRDYPDAKELLASWKPLTSLGKAVKDGKEKDFDKILASGKRILEAEIPDSLLNLETDLLSIGQSKGKFGGGKRRAWRQTQKKTMEGNVVTFSCMAIAGDKKGHIGVGLGRSKETLPSRDKAIRNAKLNIIRIVRGFESKEEDKSDPHTVPFKVEGKCGSVKIMLLPAPRGTGLVVGDECKKILKLAGIKDVYSRTYGQTRTTFNLAKACVNALNKTNDMKL